MTEAAAALIWNGDRFLICQRPAYSAIAWITPAEIPDFEFCPADKDINECIMKE